MDKKRNMILAMCLVLVIAFSCLLFFGIEGSKSNIDYTAFGFVIFTEILVFVNSALVANKKKVGGFLVLSMIYAVISLLFNVFLLGIFDTLRGLIVFNVAILIIYALIGLVDVLSTKK